MKNIEVDNRIMNDGREEMDKVLDWYQLAGWIVPCQECGTWLTSLGLCTQCGVRYEVVRVGEKAVEQLRAADVLPQCEKCGSSFILLSDGSLACGNFKCGNRR